MEIAFKVLIRLGKLLTKKSGLVQCWRLALTCTCHFL